MLVYPFVVESVYVKVKVATLDQNFDCYIPRILKWFENHFVIRDNSDYCNLLKLSVGDMVVEISCVKSTK